MDKNRKCCRLCLTENEFNVSLYSNYCRKSNMHDKIMVCLKIPIEKHEYYDTVCHRCTNNVEMYYQFIKEVEDGQAQIHSRSRRPESRSRHIEGNQGMLMSGHRRVAARLHDQTFEAAEYTFSYLELPGKPEEKKPIKNSSPIFSYTTQNNYSQRSPKKASQSWKSSKLISPYELRSSLKQDTGTKLNKQVKLDIIKDKKPRGHSRDIFESQSQEVEESQLGFDWKIAPDQNIMKRIRNKIFGHSDF